MSGETRYFVPRLTHLIAARRLEEEVQVSGGHSAPDETYYPGDYEAGGVYYRAAQFERLFEPMEEWLERKRNLIHGSVKRCESSKL